MVLICMFNIWICYTTFLNIVCFIVILVQSALYIRRVDSRLFSPINKFCICDLSHKFEQITEEIQVEIIEAKAELTASMDKILL